MSNRVVVGCLAIVVVAISLACFTPDEREITYENGTGFVVRIVSDGTEFKLKPGETRGLRTRKNFLPDHVQAYDEAGNLRFDKVISWEELEANEFRVVIR